MKVLLVNNYSMENAFQLWQKGKSGSHHVWGKIELDKKGTVQMEILQHQKYKFLNKIGRFFKISHLDQQVRVLGYQKRFDILYAPYSLANTRLLLILKWLGLFRKPIVVTVHQPFLETKSNSRMMKKISRKILLQYESSIFLSEKLMKDTIDLLDIPANIAEEKFTCAQWGPDVNFYDKLEMPLEECNYAISAGHTDRDYLTLVEAFRGIDFPLRIYCGPYAIPKIEDLPENVTIYPEIYPYIELLEHYRKARIILIPLLYPESKEGCQGMTGIQDVVALGKPVVMTKNISLNLDVENEGFGYYVEKLDINGWRKSVNEIINNQELLNRMSKNATRVFKEKFNSEIFADSLEKVFISVHKKYNV